MSNISDLKFDDKNFNKHTQVGMGLLEKSLKEFGAGRSILIDKDNNIIAGNGIIEAAGQAGFEKVKIVETNGDEIVAVKRTDISLNSKKGREMALADNATASADLEWDDENLKSEFDDEELKGWGVDLDWDNKIEKYDDYQNGSLAKKFLAPPFSVLDTRQGYWQDRKKQWLSIGMQSELGREDGLLGDGLSKMGKISTNTSIFDPVLCELMYGWFNIPNGSILDPFAGGSVRGIVAGITGNSYTGCELRKEQVEENRKQKNKIIKEKNVDWVIGDSNKTLDNINEYFDMVFSCPPYADLEVYSHDPNDLSNMPYDKFIEAYRSIISKSVAHLKDNRFAIFVVSEIRQKDGSYRGFVNDTIKAFIDSGLEYYNEIILVNAVGSLGLRAGRQFSNGRKIGRTHQNILVFYKGDMKKIKEIYKEINFYNLEETY